ncbi:MAG: NAD(P)H-dependent oxidoreductase subunit E [Bacteroidales bacterium]|nr:NAD(P)H-dependent oxidoreductase subunit E [Bacteroidales bacterium]
MKERITCFTEYMCTYPKEEGSLIPLLQKAQGELGYISPEIVETVADYLQLTESQVFGVASFYSQFRFSEPGRHSISICLGTACHVVGGEILLETCERDLEVKSGECTSDMRFDLNRVACLGCCALAPVVKIDEDIHSKVNIIKLKEMWSNYE